MSDDDRGVGMVRPVAADELLRLYDEALPEVYGYLRRRCEGREVAEDLTAETWLAAVAAVRDGGSPPLGLPWIIGVARHKLVDHWRRQGRAGRNLEVLAVAGGAGEDLDDPWERRLDAVAAHATLAGLPGHYRQVLTLRYLDDLPVPEVAGLLGVSVHAAEGLLVRARGAFRKAYAGGGRDRA